MPATPDLRALLLTDVVDSTRLTEELGDAAMAELWTTHDRIARDLLPLWRGREIDKTDGMLLLFDDVRDAVGYALAYHCALAARELPFKARAGIHVGPVSLRPNPPEDVARGAKPVEVDGIALPIAARVMSVALGAQTLLSADARLALGVAAQRVVSYGHWRMHGVTDPVELFEVGEVGAGSTAPFKAPPDGAKVYRVMRQGELWQPVREVRHSVPAERDSFVGRQEPLALLAKKFDDGARLVSVLGMGGTGKTRLVTRFAWTVLGDYPGGVWFCDLSQARTVDGIHFAVAQGLDVPLGKTDPVVQLAHAVAGRGRCLVILDNFEQVARFAEETLGRWLDRAPLAQFLVTTREVLGVVGEEMLALAPLPGSDATALFLRRAESVRQGHALGADDMAAIKQLVGVLDGLPLAIELAAARVHVIPPQALLARMNERFTVLWSRTGRRDRQATLRATFDWSWELLSEPEKASLAQLSVFDGGFMLTSANAVIELAESTEGCPSAADVVQWLVDKSLVRQVANDRFDMLECVKEYAAEHLRTANRYVGSGDTAMRAAQSRHSLYFAALEERTAAASRCAEANNLVVACTRSIEAGHAAAAVGSLANAWAALKLCGPFAVAVRLAKEVANMPGLSTEQQMTVEWISGTANHMLGNAAAAHATNEAGLDRARKHDSPLNEGRFGCALAEQLVEMGRIDEALAMFDQTLQLAKQMQDVLLQCRVLNGLGSLNSDLGYIDAAGVHYLAALELARAVSDRRWEGGLLGNLGTLLHSTGRLNEALEHYEQALSLAQQVGDRRWEGNTRCNLGLLRHEQGHPSEAQAQLNAALAIAQSIGHARLESTALCNLGLVDEALDLHAAAEGHYRSAVHLARELGDGRSEGVFRTHLGTLLARLRRFKEARDCFATAQGLLELARDPASMSMLRCGSAEMELLAGDAEQAFNALGGALALAEGMRAGSNPELLRQLARLGNLIGSACAATEHRELPTARS